MRRASALRAPYACPTESPASGRVGSGPLSHLPTSVLERDSISRRRTSVVSAGLFEEPRAARAQLSRRVESSPTSCSVRVMVGCAARGATVTRQSLRTTRAQLPLALAVVCETPRLRPVSSMFRPPKKRSSTTRAAPVEPGQLFESSLSASVSTLGGGAAPAR